MLNAERQGRPATTLLLLAVSAGLLLLLHFYELAPPGLWTKTLFESLHVPIFGAVAVSLFVATGLRRAWGPAQRAAFVCAAAIVLAMLSEGAQISGQRDASFEDLMSDWLGAGAALLFALALSSRHPFQPVSRFGFALGGLVLCVTALWPLISVSAAYVERNLQQPVLVSFDTRLGRTFRRTSPAFSMPFNPKISGYNLILFDHMPM